jgi:imidazoleglycerol-phosphate dehydratase
MIKVARKTNETDIQVGLNLYGTGQAKIDTGVPFLDHMLDQIARHGLMDLTIKCDGDTQIDDHHSVEDIGITLGQAFAKAAGDKAGFTRYGHAYVPLFYNVPLVDGITPAWRSSNVTAILNALPNALKIVSAWW